MPALRESFDRLLRAGEVATCGPVMWELLHSANNAAELSARRADLEALDRAPIDDRDWSRALDIRQALAERRGALHPSVKLHDAIIAVAAKAP